LVSSLTFTHPQLFKSTPQISLHSQLCLHHETFYHLPLNMLTLILGQFMSKGTVPKRMRGCFSPKFAMHLRRSDCPYFAFKAAQIWTVQMKYFSFYKDTTGQQAEILRKIKDIWRTCAASHLRKMIFKTVSVFFQKYAFYVKFPILQRIVCFKTFVKECHLITFYEWTFYAWTCVLQLMLYA